MSVVSLALLLLRLAPVSSYQVALVVVDARGVVGVEVGLQWVVGFHGVGARDGGAFDGNRHLEGCWEVEMGMTRVDCVRANRANVHASRREGQVRHRREKFAGVRLKAAGFLRVSSLLPQLISPSRFSDLPSHEDSRLLACTRPLHGMVERVRTTACPSVIQMIYVGHISSTSHADVLRVDLIVEARV